MGTIKDRKTEILDAFKCQNSGNCCRVEGFVYVTPLEAKNIAQSLGLDIQSFFKNYVKQKNGHLVISDRNHRPNCFLDEKNCCSVYKARPQHCRTYPDWPEIWETNRSLLQETLLCPGLKNAYETVLKASDLSNSV